MNSWRLSSHFWPTAVRNLMPSNHSSSVRCTSRAKACRCFTALVMISLKRLSFASFRRATTAAVSVSSVNWRMDSSFGCRVQVYYQNALMRLVTFTLGTVPPRTGALFEGDRKVLDLQAAYGRTYHGASPLLHSMLHIIEAGDAALDTISQLLKAPSAAVAFNREEVRLLAPVPEPPQMRDFLCFEKHLRQAFDAAGKLRRAPPRLPGGWDQRPIYHHPSRFSVCGTDTDVPWPRYCEKLDFEREFGCYRGRPCKGIGKERAREHNLRYTSVHDRSRR